MTATALIPTDEATLSTGGESCFPELDDASPVRYEIVGPRGAPVVAVLGGISASRHVTSSVSDPSPGWWKMSWEVAARSIPSVFGSCASITSRVERAQNRSRLTIRPTL